eukprot:TRINITY_DN11704_c0_g1_i1.p1 TRINITY_DN11704_c0_g1~~TRINITY_DN11704_c0_g1_i1.p1  ORF type:complete len:293 (+),score=49.42 TRINITY_DN11704_c0_g1_i1:275-1153(+)
MHSSLAPQWKTLPAQPPNPTAPRSPPTGASLSMRPNKDTWAHGSRPNSHGQLNLSSSAPSSQMHTSRKRDGWDSGKGGRAQARSPGPQSSRFKGPQAFKCSKGGPSRARPQRPEPKLSAHSILGAALTPCRPDKGKDPQQSWAVGTVRRRKVAHEAASLEEDKEHKAKHCSERLLFRKAFDSLHQYRVAEGHKETLAQQTFRSALFRKVFERLRSVGQDQDQEIAFLRELGWMPDHKELPLTESEIAAFQQLKRTVHGAQRCAASRPRPGGCLLYTSPSPRDRTRSRMPSSA